MYRGVFIFLLLSFSLSCVSSVPKWYADARSVYPADKYLIGEGEGESIEAAQERAFASLSTQFSAKVSTKGESSVRMEESSQGYFRDITMTQETEVKGEAQLLGVVFPSDFKRDGKCHLIAVMDVEKSYSLYLGKINSNNREISSRLARIKSGKNPLSVYYNLLNAGKLSDENERLVSYARVLKGDENASYETAKNLASQVSGQYEQNGECKFVDVRVQNDHEGMIEHCLRQELEGLGFRHQKKAKRFYMLSFPPK